MKTLQQRIDDEKKSLAERWQIEAAAERELKRQLREVFLELCEMGYGTDVAARYFSLSAIHDQDKLNKLLQELRLFVFMNETHAAQAAVDIVGKSYNSVFPVPVGDYVNGKRGGKTNKGLVAMYTNRFKFEAETWIAIGLLLGMTAKEIAVQYDAYRGSPFSNPLFSDAVSMKSSAIRIKDRGVTYGRGHYIGSEASLARLTRFAVEDAYREAQKNAWNSANPVGYYIFRGSTYPCALCEDMCGYHPANIAELPPFHPRCCCGCVPVFASDNTGGIF